MRGVLGIPLVQGLVGQQPLAGHPLNSETSRVKSAVPEVSSARRGKAQIIDGRAHWSVKERLGRLCLVDESRYDTYAPKNLVDMKDSDYTVREGTEDRIVRRCQVNPLNEKRQTCALQCDLTKMESSWFSGRWRAKRIRKLRKQWEDTIAAANAEAP